VTHAPTTRRRGGFTFVELLVVIAIISVLAVLVTAAVGRVRGTQQVKATEQTITKVQLGFDQQWKATLDQARDDGRQGKIPSGVVAWCNNDRDRATALWAYILLRLEFPQTFPEARTPVVLGTAYTGQPKLTFAQVPPTAPTSLAEYRIQSAVLFYIIMSERGGRGMVFSSDDVTTGEVAVSGGTFRGFKDAWGNPICFERFTASPDANTVPTFAKSFMPRPGVSTIDPLDPMAKLADRQNWDPTLDPAPPAPPVNRKTIAELAVMPPVPPGGTTGTFFQFNTAQNRMPAMMSFGPNKTIDADPLSGDDIYSYRLRRPGNPGG